MKRMTRKLVVVCLVLAGLVAVLVPQYGDTVVKPAAADASATFAAGLPSHDSDLPTYNGKLAVGQWSDLYVGNCHIKTMHGSLQGAFLRIWIVTTGANECFFEGGRLVWYTALSGLNGTPGGQGTLCQLKIGNSGCGIITPGQGSLWDLFVGFPGSGLVGSEIGACGYQVLYTGFIAKVCGRWNLTP